MTRERNCSCATSLFVCCLRRLRGGKYLGVNVGRSFNSALAAATCTSSERPVRIALEFVVCAAVWSSVGLWFELRRASHWLLLRLAAWRGAGAKLATEKCSQAAAPALAAPTIYEWPTRAAAVAAAATPALHCRLHRLHAHCAQAAAQAAAGWLACVALRCVGAAYSVFIRKVETGGSAATVCCTVRTQIAAAAAPIGLAQLSVRWFARFKFRRADLAVAVNDCSCLEAYLCRHTSEAASKCSSLKSPNAQSATLFNQKTIPLSR